MVFRYPGGKSRLVKQILEKMDLDNAKDFYEPFVGGGSVVIAVAKKNKNIKLHINDLDENVYSFWKLFELDEDNEFDNLFNLLKNEPTVDLFKQLRSIPPNDIVQKAYYCIFFNRTTFSGIYRSGPIGGYGQKSKYKINCRYNSKKLVESIKELRVLFKNRIHVTNLDVSLFIDKVPKDMLLYIDPPYYWEGKGLYNKYMLPDEHVKLGKTLESRTNWVLSYGKCKEIKEIYEQFSILQDLDCKYSVDITKIEKRKDSKEYLIVPKSINVPVTNNKGETNMSNNTNAVNTNTVTNANPAKRGRGRPKGSKNKPKTVMAGATGAVTTGASTVSSVVDYASLK